MGTKKKNGKNCRQLRKDGYQFLELDKKNNPKAHKTADS